MRLSLYSVWKLSATQAGWGREESVHRSDSSSHPPPPPYHSLRNCSRLLPREQPVLDWLSDNHLAHKAERNMSFTSIFTFISGIGQGRVTSNLQGAPIDNAVFVSDKEAVEMVKPLFLFPRTYVTRVRTLWRTNWYLEMLHFGAEWKTEGERIRTGSLLIPHMSLITLGYELGGGGAWPLKMVGGVCCNHWDTHLPLFHLGNIPSLVSLMI